MAATATQDLSVTVRAVPQISKETRDAMSRERKRLAADPAANQVPADLTVDSAFIFRTRPNTYRQLVWNLPMPPEDLGEEDPKYRFALRTWKRLVAQPAYPELSRDEAAATLIKRMEDLRERIGDTRIIFNRVARHVECFYATDDAVVADYLRELMASGRGGFDKVYEQSGKSRIVVGEQAFPNTEIGRKLAFAAAAETGATLQIVKE